MPYAPGLTTAPLRARPAPARRPAAHAPSRAAPGNQALLRRLQAKLAVGPVDDPLEHEADRVADQVMRMADPARVSSSPALQLQRKCAECEEEQDQQTLQKKSAGGADPQTAPPIVDEVLRSPGEPLDAATRAFFEPRFGHDFSHVRVHTDATAAASARMVDAAAYTVGSDLVFAGGRYAPGANDGRSLLAHELAHTIQQGASGQLRHADQNAAATRPPDGTVQRQGEGSDTDDASLSADTTSPTPANTGAAAAKSRPSCSAFWGAYSQIGYNKWKGEEQRDNVWEFIGGNVGKSFVGGNTCATRVSYGLNYGGAAIPTHNNSTSFFNDPHTTFKGKAGDGKNYIVGAPAMDTYLTGLMGAPDGHFKAGKDVQTFADGLPADACAVFAGPHHSGLIKQGYQDPYVFTDPSVMPVDAWRLA